MNFFSQVPELNITERFGKDVRNLLRCFDILDGNRSIFDVRPEVVVLQGDVFRARADSRCFNEIDATLIVLVDGAV